MGQETISYHLWLVLGAGCLGVVMGIDRTLRTRERESRALKTLSAAAGFLLIGASVHIILTSVGLAARTTYAVPFMMLLGLSLSARQLESIPFTAVFALILGLAALYTVGHGGMPQSIKDLLGTENLRKAVVAGGLVLGGALVLAFAAAEKLVDAVLEFLGLGAVVIVLSAVSVIHAALVLFTGDGRGVLQFL